MEITANILATMRLTGGVFLDAEFTAPWCVSSKIEPKDCAAFLPVPQSVVALHFVKSGRMTLQVASEPSMIVEAGEIVALPRNDPHVIGSRLDLEPVGTHALIQPGSDGRLARIRFGGGGEATSIVCGFLGTDRRDDPVLNILPSVLKLKVEDGASAAWIESSFSFAAQESAVRARASADILARLAEVLFMDAVRRYLSTLSADHVDLRAGVLDSKVAHAIGLMHGQLQHRWTTEELAQAVGLSRSSFADRFSRAMSESPMRYLSRQRLRRASQHLRSSQDSLVRIAFACGYESESAFNRAFRREFGVPPATWRKNNSGA